MMHRGAAAPQGRKGLLAWLNGLCNSEYPAVESFRDGAAYCTVIEAAASRIAQNLEESSLPEAVLARDRAFQAAKALSRLDWSATAVVCEHVDPSLDSMAVRKTCRENMTVLQEILRECVPREHTREIDVERLCTGKLQDHMRFLQWLYQFMNKALMQYSKTAIEKRSKQRPGEVEGVKLNRSQLLLEQRRKAAEGRAGQGPRHSQQPKASTSTTGAGGGGAPMPSRSSAGGVGRHSDPEKRATVIENPPFHRTPSLGATKDPQESAATRSPDHPSAASVAPLPTVAAGALEAESSAFSYARAPVVVPAEMKEMLVRARREVEELEAMAMEAHENHLCSLTRAPLSPPLSATDGAEGAEPSASERLLAAGGIGKVESPSLQDLAQLLEERDALARLFSEVDSIVRGYHAKGVSSQLLTDLCAILYP